MTDKKKYSSYRWVILVMVFLALLPCNYNQYQASILAAELVERMNMSTQQFATVMTAPMLIGFFTGILGGTLADRIGSKLCVAISIFLSAVGCFLRLVSHSYGMFFLAMLLIGFAGTFLTLCSAKLFAEWFPAEQLGAMMGVMMGAGSVATALSQATTALFSSMNTAFIFGSVWMSVMLVLWLIFVKDRPEGSSVSESVPVLEPVKKAVKSKNVWILSLVAACFMGFQLTIASFYPTALQEKGFSLATAGLYASLFTFGGFLGNMIIPNIVAKIGVNRPTLLVSGLLGFVFIAIGWLFCDGIIMAFVIACGGFFACGVLPPVLSYPPSLPEIGVQNAASASGVVTSIQMLAGFLLPSYVITPICSMGGTINFSMLFILAGILAALQGIIALFLPELGTKALKEKK